MSYEKESNEQEIGRLLKAAFPPVKAPPELKGRLLRLLLNEAKRISR